MNTQITEDYCSAEIIELLKEKGAMKDLDWRKSINGEWTFEWKITHQMAMKWLREVYNKNIILDMISLDEDCYVLWTFNVYCNKNYKIMWGPKQPKYNTYEEACDAAIKYCLTNLI